MGLSIPNIFSTVTKAMASALDGNFTAIQNYINSHVNGGGGGDAWNNSLKVGGYTPSTTPSASQVVALDANGNRSMGADVVEEMTSTTHHQFGCKARITIVRGKSITTSAANAYLDTDGTTWRYMETGAASRIDLNISSPAAPLYYSVGVGSTNAVITWGAPQVVAFTSGGSVDTANKANSLLLGAAYVAASAAPAGSQIVATAASGAIIITVGNTNTSVLDITGTHTSAGAMIKLTGDGATTPKKIVRAKGGKMEFIADDLATVIATLLDSAVFTTGNGSTTGNHKWSVELSADQTLTSSIAARVQTSVENFDVGGIHDSSGTKGRITPTVAGFYQIQASGLITSSGGVYTTVASLEIRKNGTKVAANYVQAPSGFSTEGSAVGAIVQMNGTTDYLEIWVTGATNTGSGTIKLSQNNYQCSGFLVP